MVATRSKQNLAAIPVVSLGLDPAPKRTRAPKAAGTAPKAPVARVQKAPRGRGGRARGRGRGRQPAAAAAAAPSSEPALPADDPVPTDAAPPADTALPAATTAETAAPAACDRCPRLQARIDRRDDKIADLNKTQLELIDGVEMLDKKLKAYRKLTRRLQARAEAESASFEAANAVIRGLGGTEVQRVEPAAVVDMDTMEEEWGDGGDAGDAGEEGEEAEAEAEED